VPPVRGLANRGILLGHTLLDQIAHNYHARAYSDARLHRHVRGGLEARDRLKDGEPGKDRPLGIVLVRDRIAEIGENPVAQILGYHPALAS